MTQLSSPALPFGIKSGQEYWTFRLWPVEIAGIPGPVFRERYFERKAAPERYEWVGLFPKDEYWWLGDVWGAPPKPTLLVWSFTQHNVFTGARRDIVNITNCPLERSKGNGFTQYRIETSAQSIGEVGH